jgi:hypothetical protein
MAVLVNGRPAPKFVVRECHARRVEITAVPAWQALYDFQATGVDEGHKIFPPKNAITPFAGLEGSPCALRRIILWA